MTMSLKAARVNAGLTQKQVAKAIGVCVNTLIKWERGEKSPRVEQGRRLCELYGRSWDEIVFTPNGQV